MHLPPITVDDNVPLGEVWFLGRRQDGSPRVQKFVGFNRECGQGRVGGCELGLGHPGDCLGVASDGKTYLIWERGTGRLLREL